MRARRSRTLLTAAAFVAAVAADARTQSRPAPLELLDVPYLSQSEALCGGAAAAMVMRYWGARGVYAESFSDLVIASAGGIRGEHLLRALQDRGWDARSFRGDAALVRSQLTRRRPVVTLIEDRPGRFHYVVLVAWPAGRVLLHDPARAPFRVMTEEEFVRAWEVAGFWTLLVLPGEGPAAPAPAAPENPLGQAPCAAMVDEGVRLAGVNDLDGARRLFEMSAAACPEASGPWREMAGLHALSREWRDAERDARRAVALDAADQHAWRILATARFLDGNPSGALEAWNRIGEPRVDLMDIRGLGRTRYEVLADTVAIEPGSLLTSGALGRARRRLEQVPSIQTSRVLYRPVENGEANVDVAVFERPLLPTDPPSMIAAGVRAVSDRELSIAVASPTGGGEAWTLAWRWWEDRPRVALGFSAPIRSGGVLRIEAFDDRQAYGPVETGVDERRRGATVALADWVRADTRYQVSLAAERWRDRGRFASVGTGLEHHLAHDAVVLASSGEAWFGRERTWAARASLGWRSSRAREGDEWSARAGVNAAGRQAPFALWHGAGTGPRADALLRAHPVLDGGRVDQAVLGRRLLHAGAEWRRWLRPVRRVARIAPAIFVDTGRALDGASFSDLRTHVDVGTGLRFVLPGAGVVGIDVARGLRDGKMALSIGFRH